MIDTHAHIIPGVDDGAKDIEEAIYLINQSVQDGVSEIIATPHSHHPLYNENRKIIEEKFIALKKEVNKRNIKVKLHLGQEIHIHEDILKNLKKEELFSLADSKYILLELPSNQVPMYTKYVIQEIIHLGKVPIIAHPERNSSIIENNDKLQDLINYGALSQVTSPSLTGKFGKKVQKTALLLIKKNLIHTYGSDMHNLRRPSLYKDGLRYLKKNKEKMNIIMNNNNNIVDNKNISLIDYKK